MWPVGVCVLLAATGCWHDPTRVSPAPPPPTAAVQRWVVTMGPPAFDGAGEHAAPGFDLTEFPRQVASNTDAHFVVPRVLPTLDPLARCGMGLWIRDREVAWCVDGTTVFVDDNADGDLTNDAPRTMRLTAGDPTVEVDDIIAIRRKPSTGRLVWNPLVARDGILDVAGRQLRVRIHGWFGGFGEIGASFAPIEVEGYDVHGDRVDIFDHHRLYITIERDGSRVTFSSRKPFT